MSQKSKCGVCERIAKIFIYLRSKKKKLKI